MPDSNAAPDHLPLRPVEYQILVSLSGGPRHGWAILQEIEDRGQDAVIPGLATLYRALRRMRRTGLLMEVEDGAGEEDDRRRTLALTPTGREVLLAETRRLGILVRSVEAAIEAGGGAG